MKRYIITVLINTFFFLGLYAQSNTNIYISFLPAYGNSFINFNEGTCKLESYLQLETLQFYITDISFFKNGKLVLKEDRSFHLLDAANGPSLNLLVANNDNIKFDQLKFNLGIDSLTNVSGALGGDLDPTKGMYWAWHSGYINLKLEGKFVKPDLTDGEYQFHLGGYQYPHNALQEVSLDVGDTNVLVVKFDIKNLFDSIDLSKQSKIMSPGIEGVKFSKTLARSFKLLQE